MRIIDGLFALKRADRRLLSLRECLYNRFGIDPTAQPRKINYAHTNSRSSLTQAPNHQNGEEVPEHLPPFYLVGFNSFSA